MDPCKRVVSLLVASVLVSGAGSGPARADGTEASIKGSLAQSVVRKAVREHLGEVKSCYEAQLAANPKLEGTVTVEFTVASNGSIKSAKLHARGNTLHNAKVENCILDAIMGWQLPKPSKGEVVVTYPFAFKTAGQ